ncbi:MAG: PhnA domain-containing protein [Pirellulales bacterium]
MKAGIKVNNIHLVDGGHDIDFKVPDIDAIKLKSEFVRKVQES